MPAAEVAISVGLLRRLLAAQHPDLAGLPITVLANGWDNVIFRLGDDLVARLPRRAMASALIAHELRWLPELAPRLPLPIPAPIRAGAPGEGYPWQWSIVPYLPGEPAADHPPADPLAAAEALAGFLAALHRPAPPNAPANPVRGIPLARRAESFAANLAAVGPIPDRAAVLRVWADALDAPVFGQPPVWLHGDMHPANILVHRGRVSAVIDFGDLTSGDPASDLAVAWMLLPPEVRPALWDQYQSGGPAVLSAGLWTRARGWALALGLVFLAHSADNPQLLAVGERTLREVLADQGG
jgi:aminoglycoside phosphotransferase (APT) family kinase protein